MAYLKSFMTNLKESKFCGKISREIPQVGSCTAALHNLHWLPVSSRMDYKISTLCLNTFTKSSPVHNAELLSTHLPDTSVHPRIRALSIFLSSNQVIWSKSILLYRPSSVELTFLWTPTLWIFSCIYNSSQNPSFQICLLTFCTCLMWFIHNK